MNDRPTVKVNYILDAQNIGKNYFNTVTQKSLKTKNLKDISKYVKNIKVRLPWMVS